MVPCCKPTPPRARHGDSRPSVAADDLLEEEPTPLRPVFRRRRIASGFDPVFAAAAAVPCNDDDDGNDGVAARPHMRSATAAAAAAAMGSSLPRHASATLNGSASVGALLDEI
jgi:hypothetical protein